MDYVRLHAQEMDEDVMRKHIELYVNDYSLDIGEEGRQAIRRLLNRDAALGASSRESEVLFPAG